MVTYLENVVLVGQYLLNEKLMVLQMGGSRVVGHCEVISKVIFCKESESSQELVHHVRIVIFED